MLRVLVRVLIWFILMSSVFVVLVSMFLVSWIGFVMKRLLLMSWICVLSVVVIVV